MTMKRLSRIAAVVAVLLLGVCANARAQFNANYMTATLPSTCNTGEIHYLTGTSAGLYFCTAANMWTVIAAPSATVPSGALLLILTGTCPSGFTESSALNGKMLRGTVAANGDVGQSGGADSITPAGTVSTPTFTGNSVTSSAVSGGTPAGTNGTVSVTPLLNAIAWPAGVPSFTGSAGTVPAETFTGSSVTTSATSGGTPAGTISALTTGADSSTTGGVAKAIAQTPTFTGSALGTHTHTDTAAGTNGTVSFTPAGTIAWPAGVPTVTGAATTVGAETFTGSALGAHTHTTTATGSNSQPTFTGSAFDNRPAYVNVIFCSKS